MTGNALHDFIGKSLGFAVSGMDDVYGEMVKADQYLVEVRR